MRIALPVIVVLLSLSGCTLEMSDNGSLDGMWRLQMIDTLETGVSAAPEKKIYWSVQMNLLVIEDKEDADSKMLFRFKHHSDTLSLSEPRFLNRNGGDRPIHDVEILRPYGVNALEEHFMIERLNSYRMVLYTDKLKLHFRKF